MAKLQEECAQCERARALLEVERDAATRARDDAERAHAEEWQKLQRKHDAELGEVEQGVRRAMSAKNAAIATLRDRVEASNRYAADFDELIGGARTSTSRSPHAAVRYEHHRHGHDHGRRDGGRSPRRSAGESDPTRGSRRRSGGGVDDAPEGYSPRSRSRGRARTPRSNGDRD